MKTDFRDLIINLLEIYKTLDKAPNKTIVDIDIFSQTWGSTALGFGGMGGDALTTELTTVIKTADNRWYVFFGGGFAYCVKDPTPEFYEDINNHKMASCNDAQNRY